MSKFDAVLKRIEEALPPLTQTTGTVQPPVTNQQPLIDQKIVDELVAAKTPQQVQAALQKLEAMKQVNQQKPAAATTPQPPAV